MNELKNKLNIKDMILEVRGISVMLDCDVAYLFGYDVKQLNRQVNRNIERFPENYCFRLTKEEYNSLRCQNGTLKSGRGEHSKYLPYVYTEYGITMLAGLLKSKVAVEASIKIVNEFIEMKKFLRSNDLYKNLITFENKVNDKFMKYDEKFDYLFNEIKIEDFKNKLFFNGQIYDAYSFLIDIISKADKEIIIIDNYVDKTTLDILSKKKINVVVLLITDKNKNKLSKTEIDKFNKEYPLLKIKYTNIFHDRFIILDDKEIYHLGASLKDLGNKVFGINKL